MARTEMPSSIDALRELALRQQSLLEEKQSTIDEQAELITFYREWKRLIDSQRFGSRSEKLPAEQGHLFNEAEIEAAASVDNEDQSDEVAVPAHTRKKQRRGSIVCRNESWSEPFRGAEIAASVLAPRLAPYSAQNNLRLRSRPPRRLGRHTAHSSVFGSTRAQG
jgi:hypothetical protein